MSRVRVAPGTRRSPKTTGLPPVSRSRPGRPRARRAAASHSPVARTRADSWLTEFRRTNSTSPSTIARRRDARCRSNVAQLVIVTAAVYPNVRSARQIVERRQHVHAHHVKELLDLHVLIGLRHAARKGSVHERGNAALAPDAGVRATETPGRGGVGAAGGPCGRAGGAPLLAGRVADTWRAVVGLLGRGPRVARPDLTDPPP